MIRLVEARKYRCLRSIKQPLKDFQVLVGPNASGKTTFLDVVSFLGDLVSSGLDKAVSNRTTDFRDLVFMHTPPWRFELAIELAIPPEAIKRLQNESNYTSVRYEVCIGMQEEKNEVRIFNEAVVLLSRISNTGAQRNVFPDPLAPPESILTTRQGANTHHVIIEKFEDNDNYYSELLVVSGERRGHSFRLGPKQSALGNLPADDTNFPVSTWLRETLRSGVEQIMLSGKALRHSSPPGQGLSFRPDGSNLPWVLHRLKENDPGRYRQWIEHVRTALADVLDVESVVMPDTRHRFLRIVYDSGVAIPSWTASDGTLRLLALTLPAYLPDFEGIYLIEEPENGIHPMTMETVYQSLKSVYGAQILMATHSPIVLGLSEPGDILCFPKDAQGATDIVLGSEHPKLRQWKGSMKLGDLYASGILG